MIGSGLALIYWRESSRFYRYILRQTMTRYVALLRGIAPMNPNTRDVKLRGASENLEFEHVKTVISSGTPRGHGKPLRESLKAMR